MGTICFAMFLFRRRLAQQTHERHCCRDLEPFGPFQKLCQAPEIGSLKRWRCGRPPWQESSQFLPSFKQVLDLRTVGGRFVEGRIHHVLVADRNSEPSPELAKFLLVQLLLLVRDVSSLARFAQAVALHRLCEDHRG